ncbi:MAG: hypothetical protein ACI8RD_002883 [Bacillariaceae sp.]|jgi:hypothetical protein
MTSTNEDDSKAEEVIIRRKRRRRGRNSSPPPPSAATSSSSLIIDNNNNNNNNDRPSYSSNRELSPSLTSSFLSDPFHVIAMAVDLDGSQRQSEEILQIPLETGKLYHNEKIFTRAVTHLQKESKIVRWGWSHPLPPSSPSLESARKPSFSRNINNTNDEMIEPDERRQQQQQQSSTQQNPSDIIALTPIILSGILANLNDTSMATSTELVNYCVGMRRAALARVRVRIKKDRIQRIAKPILAFAAVVFLYWYAWGNLKRVLIGFYGITTSTNVNNDQRLTLSSCRSKSENNGKLNEYVKACRMTEAKTFELLTSTNNHYHSKVLATAAEVEEKRNQQSRIPQQKTDSNIDDDDDDVLDEDRRKVIMDLMQYDDDYDDDTELPIYAMHTLLDDESSNIPLEYVIHNRADKPARRQRQRWRRRRKNKKSASSPSHQQQYGHQHEGIGRSHIDEDPYGILPEAIQFWGDTAVNRLVREAIIAIHFNSPDSSTSKNNNKNKFNLLDAGSGLCGTMFSFLTPEFPFQNWSYHGIAISQPEIRRAKQLIQTFIYPKLSLKTSMMDSHIDVQDSSSSTLTSTTTIDSTFPLTNVTLEQASFDDPLPSKEYTTIIAIESLAYSHNLTKTLINLAESLKPKGTLIIVDDVVAPWAAAADGNNNHNKDNYKKIQRLIDLTGKTSLLTHQEWLQSFAAADLSLYQPPRDLMLEFGDWPIETTSSTAATAVTGLPLIGVLLGERPWYATGHGVLKNVIEWLGYGFGKPAGGRDDDDDDDGNLSNRALSLMEDMMHNAQGNSHHKSARNRADLGYYMYICTKR